jgi:hypothetical protein
MRRRDEARVLRRAQAAQDRLAEAKRRLPHLLARDTEDAGRDGYGRGVSGRRVVGEAARPTEAVALERAEKGEPPDPYRARLSKVVAAIYRVSAATAELTLAITALDKLDAPATSKAEICVNQACQRIVTQTPGDRLKAGRCERCYRYRLRHGGDDWRPSEEVA